MSDELHDRLRAADPAADLPPADPTRVDRLLEDVMADTEHEHPRRPLAWLVAAAAVVLVAGLGGLVLPGLLGADEVEPAPTADAAPTVTELSAAGAGAGRCMVPTAEVLSGAAFALDAEVTAVADGRATLAPTTWYAGEQTDVVEVAAGSADLEALIGAPRFEEGQRYLVAADGQGRVLACGYSGPRTARLAALYAEAFPG